MCTVYIYIYWVVVSNSCYFHPYLGKIPILTNIFQRGWSLEPHHRQLRPRGGRANFHVQLNHTFGRAALTFLSQGLTPDDLWPPPPPPPPPPARWQTRAKRLASQAFVHPPPQIFFKGVEAWNHQPVYIHEFMHATSFTIPRPPGRQWRFMLHWDSPVGRSDGGDSREQWNFATCHELGRS